MHSTPSRYSSSKYSQDLERKLDDIGKSSRYSLSSPSASTRPSRPASQFGSGTGTRTSPKSSPESNDFECPFCSESFATYMKLETHLYTSQKCNKEYIMTQVDVPSAREELHRETDGLDHAATYVGGDGDRISPRKDHSNPPLTENIFGMETRPERTTHNMDRFSSDTSRETPQKDSTTSFLSHDMRKENIKNRWPHPEPSVPLRSLTEDAHKSDHPPPSERRSLSFLEEEPLPEPSPTKNTAPLLHSAPPSGDASESVPTLRNITDIQYKAHSRKYDSYAPDTLHAKLIASSLTLPSRNNTHSKCACAIAALYLLRIAPDHLDQLTQSLINDVLQQTETLETGVRKRNASFVSILHRQVKEFQAALQIVQEGDRKTNLDSLSQLMRELHNMAMETGRNVCALVSRAKESVLVCAVVDGQQGKVVEYVVFDPLERYTDDIQHGAHLIRFSSKTYVSEYLSKWFLPEIHVRGRLPAEDEHLECVVMELSDRENRRKDEDLRHQKELPRERESPEATPSKVEQRQLSTTTTSSPSIKPSPQLTTETIQQSEQASRNSHADDTLRTLQDRVTQLEQDLKEKTEKLSKSATVIQNLVLENTDLKQQVHTLREQLDESVHETISARLLREIKQMINAHEAENEK